MVPVVSWARARGAARTKSTASTEALLLHECMLLSSFGGEREPDFRSEIHRALGRVKLGCFLNGRSNSRALRGGKSWRFGSGGSGAVAPRFSSGGRIHGRA